MSEYQFYDINETVKITLLERAADMPFIAGVAEAVEKAAMAAENPDRSEPRALDLMQQVQAQMSGALLSVEPVHLARYEFYASPVTVAYAYLVDACDDWYDEEDLEDFWAFNNRVAYYEEKGNPSYEDDACLLRTAADAIREDIAAHES